LPSASGWPIERTWISSKGVEMLYRLRTAVDFKSRWVIRYEGEDYYTADRMRKHYKSKNYLTIIEKVDSNDF
jgi:hypothetical protein